MDKLKLDVETLFEKMRELQAESTAEKGLARVTWPTGLTQERVRAMQLTDQQDEGGL